MSDFTTTMHPARVPCALHVEQARADAYRAWIEAFEAANPFLRGLCSRATTEMVLVFPELRRVAGFAHVEWGRDQHWWCVTADGQIVDPTVEQFGQFGVLQYEELNLTNPADVARIPTGRCMDCGGDVFGVDTFCGPDCERSTASYMKSCP